MKYRFKERYQAVMGKREQLKAAGAFSDPDVVGSKVAILVPFIEELVYDVRDSRLSFERQTSELIAHYAARRRVPYHVMGATADDFAQALGDTSVATVVVAGFGNFSAVAVPFSKNRAQDERYGYLDWQHLAGMTTHLKLGKFISYTCGGFMREFNPPLAAGVVRAHHDILSPVGVGIMATGMEDNAQFIRPVTTEQDLTYDSIKMQFMKPAYENIPPGVPNAAYMAARGIYHRLVGYHEPPAPPIPRSTPIPYPDLRQYLSP